MVLDLQHLRVPMVDLRIFPPDKDPKRAPITIEELKKLVRCGKSKPSATRRFA